MLQKDSENNKIKDFACSSPEQILKMLEISNFGLSNSEVIKLREKFGNNDKIGQKKDTIFFCLKRAFINPFSTILFFLGIISLITDSFQRTGYQKNLSTAIIILSMLLVSGIVRFVQELKAKKIADRLTTLVHTTTKVLRNKEWVELPSYELVVGDFVKIEAGDKIPADIRLTETTDMFVSQSVITGESAILSKNPETIKRNESKSFYDYSNIVFSGTIVTGGKGQGVVIAVGKNTAYGALTPSTQDRKNGFNIGANSISKVLLRFMAILVPVVFIASGIAQDDWVDAFLFAISVAVGITPELLPMVVNACLAKGSHSMGQKQTIVKNINAMQSFGSMDTLCIDKTGTLTGDTIILEYFIDVLGNESQKVLDYAYLNTFYHTGVQNHLDSAILKAKEMPSKEAHFKELTDSHPEIDELPFDYSRKFASVLLESANENLLIIKGSLDEVVNHCAYVEHKDKIEPIGENPIRNVHAIVDEMLEDGMKVLAVAYKKANADSLNKEPDNDFILLGYLVFFDAPKSSAVSAINKLKELNVNIKILTGDHKQVALSICRRLGLNTISCLTSDEFSNLNDDEIEKKIEETNLFVELSPRQKATIVEYLQKNGHTVGFLGDGMNDLPAIIQADVGISVENATEAVKESADVILLKKDLNVLEEGILEGRKAFANMTKYIKITASSNFGNICAVVVASILLPFFPMTSIQLLLLNLLYDILCLVLPWDNVDQDIIEKPLEWSGKSLGRFMRFFGPISSVFDVLTFLFLYFYLCPQLCGADFTALNEEAQNHFISLFQTGWFLESMWTQIFILHLLRTKQLAFLLSRPSSMVVAVTLIGIIVFTAFTVTPIGSLLGLSPLPLNYYGFLVINVCLYLTCVTLAKKYFLKKYKKLI